MKGFIYIITGVLLLSACSRSSFETESKETIDSLLVAYETLQLEIENMPCKEVEHYFKEYKDLFATTQKEVSKIKAKDLRNLSFMDSFKGVKKGFKKFSSKQKKYQKDLNRKVNELNNLLKDLNNDIFDEKTLKKYLNQEKKALEKLQKEYEKSMHAVHKQKGILDTLKIIIPQKIKSLRE